MTKNGIRIIFVASMLIVIGGSYVIGNINGRNQVLKSVSDKMDHDGSPITTGTIKTKIPISAKVDEGRVVGIDVSKE